MNEIDKREKYNLLYQYYANLFTEKQQRIFTDYYQNDFSLSEIAENEEVSKQAISDQIIKIINSLDEFENELQLLRNDNQRQNLYNQLKKINNPQVNDIVSKLSDLEN